MERNGTLKPRLDTRGTFVTEHEYLDTELISTLGDKPCAGTTSAVRGRVAAT